MRKSLTLLLAALLATAVNVQADEGLKREMRTVWIATVSNIDWPQTRGTSATVQQKQKKQLTDLLDGFVKTNMNAVCLQVRPMADALYRSSYEPWSSYVSGTRGVDPGWDPLQFAVEECHKRGLEIHAWVNPYRFSNSSGNDCTTAQDQAMKESGLLMQVGSRIVFNPGLEASRQHVIKVCREMILNYDIDGIIFDDYFYPGDGTPTNSTAPDYQLWQQSGTSMNISDWRRANVNLMVREFYDMVQQTKPYVKFGIGPAGVAGTAATSAGKHGVDPCPTGSDWQYSQIYSDPLAWLEEGTIDYISPQLYWKTTHSTNPFGPLTKWWSYIAQHFGRHHYASHNIYFMASTNTLDDWKEVEKQINYSREYNLDGAPGVNFYSAKYINGPTCTGLGDYLAQNVFTTKSLTPAMTWKPKTEYAAPADARLASGTLKWTGVEVALVKYSVYAIPTSVSMDDARSTLYGGFKSDYLLGVTYEPSYTLPADKRSGFWYAVCVVDGWGNEFEPALVNAPSGYADEVTLIAPVQGATAEWQQPFEWTQAEGATYRLTIATDPNFNQTVIDQEGITTCTPTIDLSALESHTTYYWRVTTSQNGRFDKQSAVESFTTGARPLAPTVTLVSPANEAELDNIFDIVCTSATSVTSYRVQIATDPNFEQVKLITDEMGSRAGGTLRTIDLNPALLGKGTFYWRVLTQAPGCDDNASLARVFTITSVPTGNYEPGYVQLHDIDTYDDMDGLRLVSKWIRSTKMEYENMDFTNGGLDNRGIAADADRVYQIGRSEGSNSADVYINHYSAETGELMKTVPVSSEVQCNYYPGNDIFTDDAGHFLISNLLLNITNQPLNIYQVDVETGNVKQVCALNTTATTTGNRIDHCDVVGDVTTGNFTVFAAIANGSEVVRWTVAGNGTPSVSVMKAQNFCPANATAIGIAPRVVGLTSDRVVVTGGNTHPTLYNFSTGRIADSFLSNTGIMPSGTEANGFAAFTYQGKHFMLYPYSDFRNSTGHTFMLARNDSGTDFAGFQAMWRFPESGLGGNNSSTWDAPCTAVQAGGKMHLYVYSPANGLAAYVLQPNVLRGDVNGDGEVNVADVTALVNLVLNGDANERSDVNGDDETGIADVTALVNIIMAQ